MQDKHNLLFIDPDLVDLTVEQNAILKANGKTIIAYLSLGQTESKRDYWQPEWRVGSPSFICGSDPEFKYSHVVKFWMPEWQDILINYTATHIVPFGYSGVLLDYMAEYKYFLRERPNAAQEMVAFGAKVVDSLRSLNPRTLIIAQDSVQLYQFEQYKDMVDVVSIEVWATPFQITESDCNLCRKCFTIT